MPATPENIRRALQFVEATQAGGRTMMLEGVTASLRTPREPDRMRFVCFLTDGMIGNEVDILRSVKADKNGAHLLGFGVGSSTKRFLIEGIAHFGDGVAAYLGLEAKRDDVMAAAFARLSRPALTEVKVDWHGASVGDVYPERVPDLFVGSPFILTGRYTGPAPTTATLHARSDSVVVKAKLAAAPAMKSGLRELWVRQKIETLSERDLLFPSPDSAGLVRATGLENNLLSAYTSFVAVDSSRVTAGDHETTVTVPVAMPDGVRYETAVSPNSPHVRAEAEGTYLPPAR